MTSNTSQQGTVGFQAPELFKVLPKVDVKVDVYSVGCVLIELFSGRAVWEGLLPMQILYKVGPEGIPPSVENVSPRLQEYVVVALHWNQHNGHSLTKFFIICSSWQSECTSITIVLI